MSSSADTSTPFLSLIVPVYDEEENLNNLHQAIVQAIDHIDFETIYVNDGSKDGSAKVLEDREHGLMKELGLFILFGNMDKQPL